MTDLPSPYHSSSSSASSSDSWSSTDSEDTVQLLAIDAVPDTEHDMKRHIDLVKHQDVWRNLKSEDLAPFHRQLALLRYSIKRAYDSEDDEGNKKKSKKSMKPDKRQVNEWRTKLFQLSAGALAEALHQLLDHHPGTFLKLRKKALKKLHSRFQSRDLPSLSLHPVLLREKGTYATLKRMFRPEDSKREAKYGPTVPSLLDSYSGFMQSRAYRKIPSERKKTYFRQLGEELKTYMRATLVILQEVHIVDQGKIMEANFRKARNDACDKLYRVWERVRYTLLRQLAHSKEADTLSSSRRPSTR